MTTDSLKVSSQKEREAVLRVSVQARALVTLAVDTSFDCGEWSADEDVTYEAVADASSAANVALCNYIAELEAKVAAQ